MMMMMMTMMMKKKKKMMKMMKKMMKEMKKKKNSFPHPFQPIRNVSFHHLTVYEYTRGPAVRCYSIRTRTIQTVTQAIAMH